MRRNPSPSSQRSSIADAGEPVTPRKLEARERVGVASSRVTTLVDEDTRLNPDVLASLKRLANTVLGVAAIMVVSVSLYALARTVSPY